MYNHFEYCEMLAKGLKAICHTDEKKKYYRATNNMELEELNTNISSAHGTILIAIDGSISSFHYNNADNLMHQPVYAVVIAQQTKSTDTETIFKAQKECKDIALQVIARMNSDAYSYKHNCQMIDKDSLRIDGFGPIGDLFYGVMLQLSLTESIDNRVNDDYWL